MFRRYTISIEVVDDASVELDGLERVLGCSISEPSNWVEYGSTTERGLTFLDRKGNELSSPVFQHQPYFPSSQHDRRSESDEIKHFVYEALSKHYPVTPAVVKVRVDEYHRV